MKSSYAFGKMSFIRFFRSCLLIFSPLMVRGQTSIEEFNWKTYSRCQPFISTADRQVPPLFHSSSIQCILKCMRQTSCTAVCIHSESRCRMYTDSGNKTVAILAEQTVMCFVNDLHGSDKYIYGKTNKKNGTVDQTAIAKDFIMSPVTESVTQVSVSETNTQASSVTESVTQASVSGTTTQTSRKQDKGRMHPENAVNCSQGQMIVHTREGINQCRPVLSSQPTLSSKGEERNDRMTRILMFRTKYPEQGRQFYLNNNSVVDYPFCHVIKGQAVAYIPSQKKLLVSSEKPCLLFFIAIDEEKKIIIETKYKVAAIAIDDEQQFVFMKVVKPEQCVSVMSTDGKNITSLFNFRSSCRKQGFVRGGLVAYHKRSLIYFCCRSSGKILQFTYKGVPKGSVVGNVGNMCAFHVQRDILYFEDNERYLRQLSLSDHSITAKSFKIPHSSAILTVGNMLYMIAKHHEGNILVANMSDMGNVTEINTGYKGRTDVVMCFIP